MREPRGGSSIARKLLFLILVALILLVAVVSGLPQGKGAPRNPPPAAAPDMPSPTDLALDDPVEALLRYGTPADAARLAEQGVDLAALGYRPPAD